MSATCWQRAASWEGQGCCAWTKTLPAHWFLGKQWGIAAPPEWYVSQDILQGCALTTGFRALGMRDIGKAQFLFPDLILKSVFPYIKYGNKRALQSGLGTVSCCSEAWQRDPVDTRLLFASLNYSCWPVGCKSLVSGEHGW